MPMTEYDGNVEIITNIGTTPDERGLSTDQFKAKFDEGLKAFVTWFNDTHKTEFDAKASASDLQGHIDDTPTDADGVHGLKIEEGTWTPTLAGVTTPGTNTYSTQSGIYYKVGKLVTIKFEIALSAKDAAMAGPLKITGLPFFNSGAYFAPTFSMVYGVTLGASYSHLTGYSSDNAIVLLEMKGTWDNLFPASISATAVFKGSMTYKTN